MYTKQGNKIIETTTTVVEHDATNLLARLEGELENMVIGRDDYLDTVNANIASLQSKIAEIKALEG